MHGEYADIPLCLLFTMSSSNHARTWEILVLMCSVYIVSRPYVNAHLQYLQNKSTGQLSNATYIANFGGCIARMFTSYKEGGGISMIRAYALGMVTACCKPDGRATVYILAW